MNVGGSVDFIPSHCFKNNEDCVEILHFFSPFNIIKTVIAKDSLSCHTSLEMNNNPCDTRSNYDDYETMYGYVGMVTNGVRKYIILITLKRLVGTFCNDTYVYSLTNSFTIIPLMIRSNLTDNENDEYLDDMEKMTFILNSGVYYSESKRSDYNICETMQSHFSPIKNNIVNRFIWNHSMICQMEEFLLSENADKNFFKNQHNIDLMNNMFIKVIHGHISIEKCIHRRDDIYESIIISRRSFQNNGRRFKRRGIDSNGNAANFIETEQIIHCTSKKTILSHVQIRGSLPFIWQQQSSLFSKPPVYFDNVDIHSHVLALEKHMSQLKEIYSTDNITMLSLLSNKVRDEDNMTNVFCTILNAYDDKQRSFNGGNVEENHSSNAIRMIPFDMNKHLSLGIAEVQRNVFHLLSDNITAFEDPSKHIFHVKYENDKYNSYSIISNQSIYIRTNCLDCLDRTNLAQFIIVEKLLSLYDNTLLFTPLFECMKKLWISNGDFLSLQYTGSYALKSDYIKYGYSTMYSKWVHDVKTSMFRYLTNNFNDDYAQECYDLFNRNNNNNNIFISSATNHDPLSSSIFLNSRNAKSDSSRNGFNMTLLNYLQYAVCNIFCRDLGVISRR